MKRVLTQDGGVEWMGGRIVFGWIYYSELGCFSECCITWELI